MKIKDQMMPFLSRLPRFARSGGWAAVTVAAFALGACSADRSTTGSLGPTDVRERHPIVLSDGARKLDIFVNGYGALDGRQRDDLRIFAEEYRRYGQSALAIQVPTGGLSDPLARRTAASVRAALASSGVGSGRVAFSRYDIADPTLAAPIRLSFKRLQAKVGSTCGLWPSDLGVGDFAWSNTNEAYWNLGCATQSNMAAQVADPLDLVRGRAESRIDTIRRTNNFDKLRKGTDPSVPWRQDGQTSSKQAIQ